jgi:glycosyltransferase involved in cell wall biosynthesis
MQEPGLPTSRLQQIQMDLARSQVWLNQVRTNLTSTLGKKTQKLRVVALLAVRNEERHLARCLEHLYLQGVETCIIDNDSTDSTLEIARKFIDRGVFRIESFPFNGIYEWEKILLYKEKLAEEIESDWFIHHDADEIRQAPVSCVTLLEGILEVDRQGYNAINFDEFVFMPVNENESFEGKDYVQEMQNYYFFQPQPLHRVNAWKKTSNIDLHSSGGHHVKFSNQSIYPIPFVLRHYIILSKEHAIEKYGDRQFSPSELARGWHKQRSDFSDKKLRFVSKEHLKQFDHTSKWDRSEPWKEHKFITVN